MAWDFGYGQPFDKPVRNEVFASCKPDYITGLSLLGGEPMEPENQRELVTFVQNFKALYPKKTVWCGNTSASLYCKRAYRLMRPPMELPPMKVCARSGAVR